MDRGVRRVGEEERRRRQERSRGDGEVQSPSWQVYCSPGLLSWDYSAWELLFARLGIILNAECALKLWPQYIAAAYTGQADRLVYYYYKLRSWNSVKVGSARLGCDWECLGQEDEMCLMTVGWVQDPLTLLFVLILQTSLQMNLNTLISDPRPITDGYFK